MIVVFKFKNRFTVCFDNEALNRINFDNVLAWWNCKSIAHVKLIMTHSTNCDDLLKGLK